MINKRKAIQTFNFDSIGVKHSNLGDHFQSLAVCEVLGINYKDAIWIGREDYDRSPSKQKVKNKKIRLNKKDHAYIIWQGYHLDSKKSGNRYSKLSKYIHPLFISFHLQSDFVISNKYRNILKSHEPIGCRDLQTLRKLKNEGIDAYFSGCVTWCFNNRKIAESEIGKRRILIILDTWNLTILNKRDFAKDSLISKPIVDLLKKYKYSDEEINNIEFKTQIEWTDKDESVQFEKAEKRLDELSRYDLIITNRIHVLMPAMSLGTKAIFFNSEGDDSRFEGLIDYWNTITVSSGKVTYKINEKKGMISNSSFDKKAVENIKTNIRNHMRL